MTDSHDYTSRRQAEALMERLPMIIRGTLLLSLLITLVLVFFFQLTDTIIWLAYMVVVGMLRWFWLAKYRAQGVTNHNDQYLLNTYMLGSILSGLGIGFLVYYFFDLDQLMLSVVLLITYMGFTTAGASANSVYMPAFLSFSFPPTLLVATRLFQINDQIYLTTLLVVIIFYIMMLFFARNGNRTFLKNVLWDHQKQALIDELHKQKGHSDYAETVKQRFLSSLRHDIRQPLHALVLFHEVLRYRLTDPESVELLDRLSESMSSINQLVQEKY